MLPSTGLREGSKLGRLSGLKPRMPQVWIVGDPDDTKALFRNDAVNRTGREGNKEAGVCGVGFNILKDHRASPRSRGDTASMPYQCQPAGCKRTIGG